MKVNPDKQRLIVSRNDQIEIKVGNETVKSKKNPKNYLESNRNRIR